MLAEGILGAAYGVLAEVVCGKLVSLAQELAVLRGETVSFCVCFGGELWWRKMRLSGRGVRVLWRWVGRTRERTLICDALMFECASIARRDIL